MVAESFDIADVSTAPRWRRLLPDGVFLLLLLLAWVYFVTPIVTPERRHGGDILRDMAAAINVQHGQVLADPAYRGEAIWYPPLSPMIVGGLSSALRVDPADCYIWSQLAFNWLIPVGFYLLVRLQWGRLAAIGATIALLLAMPWWQSSVCRGQASIQAVVGAWVALLLYAKQWRGGGWGWTIACGVAQGVAVWHHPLLPVVLAITFVGQWVWSVRLDERSVFGAALLTTRGNGKKVLPLAPGAKTVAVRGRWRREAVILGITLLVSAPVLYLMLHGPVLNTEPREYLADELRTAEFPLMRNLVWVWAIGLLGLVSALRGRSMGARVLVVGLLCCVLGQIPGYARILDVPGARLLPVVVPHEFQLVFQLGWAACVGVGIERFLRFVGTRLGTGGWRRWAMSGLTVAAMVVTGVGGVRTVPENLRHFLHHYGPRDADFRVAAEWIRANTNINDLFMCDADLAFAWLSPQTGRKIWVTGHGHGNPRVDWYARRAELVEMGELDSSEAFWRMARERGVDYCVLARGWTPRVLTDPGLGPRTVPRFLEPVFVADRVHILRVVPDPQGESPSVADSQPNVR